MKQKHGKTGTPEFRAWCDMLGRCMNPNHKAYKNYGGRGIQVCLWWQIRFENFLSDVGCRPNSDYSLDRIDNNGHYERGNVKWSTLEEQNSNRRNNFVVVYRGEQLPLVAAMRKAKFPGSVQVACYRLKAGWSVESALETPVRDYIPRKQDDERCSP
jgi:hypothetical protein